MTFEELLEQFAANDADVAYWREFSAVSEEDWIARTGEQPSDCVGVTRRFVELARAHGFDADVVEIHPGPEADYFQGFHHVARVRVDGKLYGVDWTARQLEDLVKRELACPLVWTGSTYPDLPGIDFTGPTVINPAVPDALDLSDRA